MIKRYWVLLLVVAVVAIVGIAIAAWSGGSTSEERLTLKQVPPQVKATLLEIAARNIKEIERETKNGNVLYEAEILIGGKLLEVVIAPDGKVVRFEAEEDEDEDEAQGADDEDEVEGADDDEVGAEDDDDADDDDDEDELDDDDDDDEEDDDEAEDDD
jgi:hypothetical protein